MPGEWPERGKDPRWTLSHQGQVRPGGCAHPEPSEATVAGVSSSQMEAAGMEPGTPGGKDPSGATCARQHRARAGLGRRKCGVATSPGGQHGTGPLPASPLGCLDQKIKNVRGGMRSSRSHEVPPGQARPFPSVLKMRAPGAGLCSRQGRILIP